jgi:hypothetical protein
MFFVVVFVVAGCNVYVLAVVVSFIVVFLYWVCALFMCNLCYLSSYCTTATGLKPNCSLTNVCIYIYIYIYPAPRSAM